MRPLDRTILALVTAVVGCEQADPARAPEDPPPIRTAEPVVEDEPPDPEADAAQPKGLPFRLAAERAVVLAGAASAIRSGEVPKQDSEHLLTALDQGYARMADDGLHVTFDGLEATGQATRTLIEPDDATELGRRVGVVFLHGYGGPFAIQCWHVAKALERARPITLCPSIGTKGAWWTQKGLRVIKDSADRLRDRGATRIILVGLSNGARGAAKWASRLDPLPDGVVVISGAASRPPPKNTPVLALTGRNDTMFSPRAGRRYAHAAGEHGRYVTLPGGHFAFLEHWPAAAAHLDEWLAETDLVAAVPP